MITIAILAALALIAGLIALLTCNDLMQLLVRSESALLNIEVLLKVRHDLVPSLLETVRDHAGN
jgi:hypothetical protein